MDKKSTPEWERMLKDLGRKIPPRHFQILTSFCHCYRTAADSEEAASYLLLFLELVEEQFRRPFLFEPYHQSVRRPIDYYRFGLDFIRLLVDLPHSHIDGLDYFERLAQLLKKGDNVILLANHQTESDPQAIAVLLEQRDPETAASMIFVAGERVITDPLAVPFSMGCNLLCIYSKRYIDHPPEEKVDKLLHNKKTMELMSRLLKEGGKIIYVAPSGGRDRMGPEGIVEVAPFDPDSIEMIYLMARKAKRPTHFVPFALATYDLLPPPETVQRELGEARIARRTPVAFSFAPPFDMEHFCGAELTDKKERREARAREIQAIVVRNYRKLKAL